MGARVSSQYSEHGSSDPVTLQEARYAGPASSRPGWRPPLSTALPGGRTETEPVTTGAYFYNAMSVKLRFLSYYQHFTL